MARPELDEALELLALTVAQTELDTESLAESDTRTRDRNSATPILNEDELPEILGEDGEDYAEDPEGDVSDRRPSHRPPGEYDLEIVELLVDGRPELDVDVPMAGMPGAGLYVTRASALLADIGRILAREQRDYLLSTSGDIGLLKVLQQETIAAELGVDKSRISEHFTKLVLTPYRGVIPLRDLVVRLYRSEGRKPLHGDFPDLVAKVRRALEEQPKGKLPSAPAIRRMLEKKGQIRPAKVHAQPHSDSERLQNRRREAAANRSIQRALQQLTRPSPTKNRTGALPSSSARRKPTK